MSTETQAITEAPKRRVRGKTISIKRLSKRALERGRVENPPAQQVLPRTRGECKQGSNVMRPCPFVSCKHHLYLDVSPRSGALKLNFPHLEVWDLPESCALDVADRGGTLIEEVGELLSLGRSRVRQIESAGLAKLKGLALIAESAEEGREVFRSSKPPVPRSLPSHLGIRVRVPVPPEILAAIEAIRAARSLNRTAAALGIGKQTLYRILAGVGTTASVIRQLRANTLVCDALKRAA